MPEDSLFVRESRTLLLQHGISSADGSGGESRKESRGEEEEEEREEKGEKADEVAIFTTVQS